MNILESPFIAELVTYIKANWSSQARVDQHRRRLRQLVTIVRAVADAAEGRGGAAVRDGFLSTWLNVLRAVRGQAVLEASNDTSAVAAGSFLARLKALFVCNAEVDRLTGAVEELERFVGPGGDLDLFLKALLLDPSPRPVTNTNVAAVPVSSGVKRKHDASSAALNEGSAMSSRGHRRKHRVVAWMSRDPQSTAGPSARPPVYRPHRARKIAEAMGKVRRRAGSSQVTRWGRPSLRQACCGLHIS
jgi:hypothetical protein